MNHDQAIEALKAHKKGKAIQGRPRGSTGPWEDFSTPHFNFNAFEFRAKPEPRTLYINFYSNDEMPCAHTTVESAENGQGPEVSEVAVKFVEAARVFEATSKPAGIEQ
jgi:hypothetical protein